MEIYVLPPILVMVDLRCLPWLRLPRWIAEGLAFAILRPPAMARG